MQLLTMFCCTSCNDFSNTISDGAVCNKIGLNEMLNEKTWPNFNADFNAGTLTVSTPSWCPRRIRRSRLCVELQSTVLRNFSKSVSRPFEVVYPGNTICWLHENYIHRAVKNTFFRIKESLGTEPFVVKKIYNIQFCNLTTFVFLTKENYEAELNINYFSKCSD